MSVNKVQGTGFAQIANEALRDKRLSFRARGVLAMVLSYSGEWDSPRDWLETMSDKDGREAIQSALNELTALGYRRVVKVQKPDGTWFTETHWMHTPDTDVTEGRVSRPSVEPTVGEPVLPPEHQPQNTETIGEVHQFALVAPAADESGSTDLFDTFWSVYPKKVDKGAARKAWKSAVKKAPQAVIIAAARRYGDERRDRDRAFTKNPATWLNAESWDNEPMAPEPKGRPDDSWMFRQDFGNPLEGIKR